MSEGAAPRSVNYADTLPLAVASTQNRRSFFPQNGQSFTDTSSNIIRIDVNADGLLDVQQSYLEFTLENNAAQPRALDQGHCWIKRLTIESAGVILEDINNYNRLVGGVLQPAQGSAAYTGEIQVGQFAAQQNDAETGFINELAGAGLAGAAIGPTDLRNGYGVIAQAGAATSEVTGQYHLVCGLLNMDKYLPLVLMGQGFTIQLELETGKAIGVMQRAAGGVVNPNEAPYTIKDVKYVAHIVEMQRDFYDMLRNLQSQSGGSLMIGSSTFRHFSHADALLAGTHNVNISARVRSLESLLMVSNTTTNLTSNDYYGLSSGTAFGAASGNFNVFIGAQRYPSNTIRFNTVTNKGEAYQELRKCFGALGSINHGGMLNASSYLSSTTGQTVDANLGGLPTYAPLGISFRSFRHELEDGIDTSSRALPIRLELTTTGAAAPQTIDIFAQATVLFYINMDGSVSASV
eukprot:SAG11_NODE_1296_length_5271_cov_7.677688_5_plen_463_part_00